jgi:endonuclease/exonuclease/phosphatase family metal-dependent hydrolase
MGPVQLEAACQEVTTLDGPGEIKASVRWLGPASPDEVKTLSAWCAEVGPALVDAQGSKLPGEAVNRIAVISWNLHVGRGDLARLLVDLHSGRLTGGEPVRDFVLLLQEAVRVHPKAVSRSRGGEGGPNSRVGRPDRDGFHDIADWGRDLGLAVFYAPSMRNDPSPSGEGETDRGNAILSTLPLADLKVINLPFERQRRAALVATVQAPDRTGAATTLRVVTVHLDVWPALVPSLVDPTRRFRQAAGLLEAAGGDSLPLLIGGDFNTASVRDPLITNLRKQFPEAVLPSSCRTKYRWCPDYIFQRLQPGWGAAPYRILDETYGSDHRPLVMVVNREAAAQTSSAAR